MALKRRRFGPLGMDTPSNELKYSDVVLSSAAGADGLLTGCTSAASNVAKPSLTLLNGVTEGPGPSDRIGRRINLRSLLLRWKFDFPATTYGTVRLLVFYDRGNNGVADTAANYQSALLATTDVMSTPNMNNRERFTILMDKCFAVDSAVNTGSFCFKKFKYLNMLTQYNATGSTADKISYGALYLMGLVGGTAMQTAQMPLTSLVSHLVYEDD